ncbi:SDR family oxidoreductase [Roseomonas sp. SSH11]|uniref:SDR family oxidoreductase n=1 Tax=Pararoseomonas baculiformis TaxID=2820812 RepID=A0ABS4AD84_9PROT|nr:SDR family oxidoreductase [Pararoseomonas baculiformis]MBP0444204.1 SDR family oxidoreductase [Pararoseomonas baculiformis]
MGVILVTGSGRGIGAATARLAARRGHAVVVNYAEREERARAVVEEIRAGSGRAIMARADVSREEEVEALFAAADQAFGPLTGLVNNAGITGPATRTEDYDAATIRRILDVNVTGTFLCTQAAIQRMSTKQGGAGGAIVNLSSIAATIGGGGQWTAYAAAKGAVNSLTLGLSKELAPEGIRVNALLPGLIDTEIHATAGVGDRLAKMAPSIPMGRIGTAEECAEAILWLLSGEAAYLTGALIPMAGGR